jgi:hypothetical protein
MAKLTSKGRERMKSSEFAIPKKRAYPINDKAHARNALARVAQNGTPAEQAKVRKAVKKKYPSIGKEATAGSSSKKDKKRNKKGKKEKAPK